MKDHNKSCKCFSSCASKVTINYCLTTFFIIILSVNYSHAFWFWWTGPEPEVPTTEPPKENPKTTTDSGKRSPSEDVTPEPAVENHWPIVNCSFCEFSCHSKRLCIRPHLVCDGINDCDDGSDELPCPNVTSIIDPALDCENGECPRSYERNPGECNCQCLGDSRCAAWVYGDPVCTYRKGEVPLIVFSTLNDLFQADLPENRTEVQVIQRNMGHRSLYAISAFDYRAVEKLLIWFDSIENKIFTGRVNLEQEYLIGIHGRQVVIGGTNKIHAFVYDGMNYALIWIDDYGIRSEKLHETSFIAMNQTKLYRILNPSYDRPGSITIDVKKQCIFWTNIGANSNILLASPKYIERIDISGEHRAQKIVETNILRPVGLAVDTKNTKVYWIDGLYGTLESVGYDGTNRITLYESLPFMDELISMDIFSNYLYFTDKINSTIQRININNAVKKVDTLISVPNGSPTWVKIVNLSKRKRKSYVRLLSLFQPKNTIMLT